MARLDMLVVQKGSAVALKIITAANETDSRSLIMSIRRFVAERGRLPTRVETYGLAKKSQFFGGTFLVVMDEEGLEFYGEGSFHLPASYRESFGQAVSNPLWKPGMLDSTQTISV